MGEESNVSWFIEDRPRIEAQTLLNQWKHKYHIEVVAVMPSQTNGNVVMWVRREEKIEN